MRSSCYLLVLAASIALPSVQAVSLFDELALKRDEIVFLQQNWDEDDREFFYNTDQGSRLLPYDLFLHLERAGSTELLRSDDNILRMGFIPGEKSTLNPDALPVGFTRNDDYMGLSCAACHTQQLKYDNKIVRIDGGQAMADLPLLLSEMVASMSETLKDAEKFRRLQESILGADADSQAIAGLREELKTVYAFRKDYNRRNATDVAYGFSRLDAFGAILNKALFLTGVKDNFNSPNAPTSYPYIWDTPQHDYVEWNGSQTNSSLGALARNVGEVIGVYGEVHMEAKTIFGIYDAGYESSVEAGNLRDLEKRVASLQSPVWPDFFPPIDESKLEKGRTLYVEHCGQCHLDINRSDPARHIKVRMSSVAEIKTDSLMAENTVNFTGKTGILQGKKRFYAAGPVMGETAPALFILNNIMGGVLKNNALQVLLAKRDATALGHPEELHPPKYLDGKIVEKGKEVTNDTLLAYKARPMNGVWATAPFLHNGSVPNLYELLLPEEQRSKEFFLGTLEYDPVKVGYVDEYTEQAFRFDTTLAGNSNAGHNYFAGEYGNQPFSEDEIQALLEYLKSL